MNTVAIVLYLSLCALTPDAEMIGRLSVCHRGAAIVYQSCNRIFDSGMRPFSDGPPPGLLLGMVTIGTHRCRTPGIRVPW